MFSFFKISLGGYIRQLCDISFHRIRPAGGVWVRPDRCSSKHLKLLKLQLWMMDILLMFSLHYLQIPEGDVFI